MHSALNNGTTSWTYSSDKSPCWNASRSKSPDLCGYLGFAALILEELFQILNQRLAGRELLAFGIRKAIRTKVNNVSKLIGKLRIRFEHLVYFADKGDRTQPKIRQIQLDIQHLFHRFKQAQRN